MANARAPATVTAASNMRSDSATEPGAGAAHAPGGRPRGRPALTDRSRSSHLQRCASLTLGTQRALPEHGPQPPFAIATTAHRPVVLQCHGSSGRLNSPYDAACAER